MKKIAIFALVLVGLVSLAACNTADAFDPESTVNVYTRDTTSGTREAFFKGINFSDAVDDNSVLVSSYVEVAANAAMMTAVANDEYGLGYISLSALDDTLTGLSYEGVVASEANVLNDTYGLKRPFMYMTRDAASETQTSHATANLIVEAFVAFMETSDGKAIIKDHGGIVSTSSADQSWDDIKANYPVVAQDTSSVVVKFGGSTSVESIAKALSAAFASLLAESGQTVGFIAEHNHVGSGAAYDGVQGADKEDAAAGLDIGFASRSFSGDELTAINGSYGQLAWDAVVAVVNNANTTITNITAAQLKSLYEGAITKWSELA